MPITESSTILKKYRILRLIGEGGMARVWLAEEPAFGGRQVAIKEVRRSALSVADYAEQDRRFVQEVELSARLMAVHAPYVVAAYTAERTEDDSLLLVMEYAAGGAVTDLLRQHPKGVPVDQALALVRQVCAALAALHDLPGEPVHRDVKPSNILLTAAGEARLSDFGLAQMPGSSGRSLLTAASHPGTPTYSAPEQMNSNGYLGPAADIYALGCVLFELLTGKRYKSRAPGTKPSAINAAVPAWLDEVVSKALAQDPWDRYETAAQFGEALTPPAAAPMEAPAPAPAQPGAVAAAPAALPPTQAAAATASPAPVADSTPADGTAQRKAETARYIESGRGCHQQKDYGSAVANFSKAIKLDPNNAAYYFERGKSYHLQKDYGSAVVDFSKAIELDPNNAEYYKSRGVSYHEQKDYARAIADKTKAIELDPNNALYYQQRGVSYGWQGDHTRAIADYTKAIELDPNNAEYYKSRGVSYHGQKDYARAIADKTKAIELDPNNAEYYYSRGVSYGWQGDHTRAIADYTKAIELDPGNGSYYYSRAISYRWLGRHQEAQQDEETARRLGYTP